MASKDIKVTEVVVVDGKPVVRGTVGEVPFEAATKQWGSKMLMNVAAEGLDRGTRIAIGHAAKRAVKAAQMVLPEAVLKLRQGVGRLIRTRSDRGIVAILDPRILTKSYGRAFLKALPPCPVEVL